ncbi:hypothetical protein GG344DRAFT_72829 [Lentinula edodes]|nr:hypothetical protein GG344DRAFT_72829 [Lentinula edodes]
MSTADALLKILYPDKRLAPRTTDPKPATLKQRERIQRDTAEQHLKRQLQRSEANKRYYEKLKVRKQSKNENDSHLQPKVTWSTGQTTSLPFLPDENGKNLYSKATTYVQEMAEIGIHDPELKDPWNPFHFLDLSNQNRIDQDLWISIDHLLSQGKVVVLRNSPVSKTIYFNTESICTHFGLTKKTSVNALDMRLQEDDSSTQLELQKLIEKGYKGHMTSLDTKITPGAGALDLSRSYLSDGHKAWSQTDALQVPPLPLVSLDVIRGMSWALISNACSHSTRHADSSGCATHVTISCGQKIWGIVQPIHSSYPKQSASRLFHSSTPDTPYSLKDKLIKLFIVELRAGDTIIQPPYTFHTVYTPVPTVATGGHFHTRDVDITNHEEDLSHYVLIRMILALPQGTSIIPKRPLVALSIMILEWKQYYSNASHTFMADVENVEAQRSSLEDLAEKMAQQLLKSLGMNITQAKRYLRQRDWKSEDIDVDISLLQSPK